MKRVSVRASRTILYTYYSRSETKCRQKCGFRQLRGFPFSQQQRPAARMQYKVELSKNTKKCKFTYCLTLKRLKSMFYFRKEKYLNGAKQRQNLHIGSHKKYYIFILQYFSIFNPMYYSRSKCGVKFCFFCPLDGPIRLRLNLYVVYNIVEE